MLKANEIESSSTKRKRTRKEIHHHIVNKGQKGQESGDDGVVPTDLCDVTISVLPLSLMADRTFQIWRLAQGSTPVVASSSRMK